VEDQAKSARDFLDAAIMDYNLLFSKNKGLAAKSQ